MKPDPVYQPAQQILALTSGIFCHLSFLAAIAVMAASLFLGLQLGQGHLHGAAALFGNCALLLSFPLLHSWLLAPPGRRFMFKLVPLNIGQQLSTTVFATIASLQLLMVFLLWSPSGIVWWHAAKWQPWAIGAAAAGAWLLVGKSMSDAQLSVQSGFLGWSSVCRNRKTLIRPFSTRGLYSHVRQPIYISFALLLWLSSVWTPDQLAIALLWTTYCVAGSALKEKRFIRFYGDAFRQYQARVPFWIPRLSRKAPPLPPSSGPLDADVLIVGAGPVGLLLACLLGKRGLRVLVAERRTRPPQGSMAIGITPPSLQILSELGLDSDFVRRGIPIATAKVFEDRRFLGDVHFSRLPTRHRFILSLPQTDTIQLLKKQAASYPSVRLLEGVEYTGHVTESNSIRARFKDTATAACTEYVTSWVAGCDGHRSRVRDEAGIRFPGRPYRAHFLMADIEDRTHFGSDAHLYFGPHGSVESFPLPGNLRRWIILAPRQFRADASIAATVVQQIRERTGLDLAGLPVHFESPFRPQRHLAGSHVLGRVLLCGNAAHVMSPIGGQGMNTGFADAAHLAQALSAALAAPERAPRAFAQYSKARRRAFTAAARRAQYGMWLGTRTGPLASVLRQFFITRILFRASVRDRLAPYFAMLTIPCGDPASEGSAS